MLKPNYNVVENTPVSNNNSNYEGPIIPINLNRIMEAQRNNLGNLPALPPYTIPPSFLEERVSRPRKIVRKTFGTLPLRLRGQSGGKKISRKRKWRSRPSTRRR